MLCSSHKLTPLLFSYGLLRRKFTLSLLLPNNFTSHFPKLKPANGSGSDMPDSVGCWEIIEFSFPYWRADISDGPGSNSKVDFILLMPKISEGQNVLGKRKGKSLISTWSSSVQFLNSQWTPQKNVSIQMCSDWLKRGYPKSIYFNIRSNEIELKLPCFCWLF